MNGKLQRQFDGLERQKSYFLNLVTSWPAEQARFRSSPQCWSGLDVLDHVLKTESSILQATQMNLAQGGSGGLENAVRRFMVMWVMRAPTRVRVPASAQQVMPVARHGVAEIAEEWRGQRGDLRALLESLQLDQLRLMVFEHPVGGWMRTTHMLEFLSVHMRHHGYQLARIARDYRRAANLPVRGTAP